MSVFTVDTRSVNRFAFGCDRAAKAWPIERQTAGQQSGAVVMKEMQSLSPVRSGDLRAKIGPPIITRIGAVGLRINVPLRSKHARWVVEGRRGFEARPGHVLRFTLPSGQVLYRKRVGPAAANDFPTRAFAVQRAHIVRLHQDALRRVIKTAVA